MESTVSTGLTKNRLNKSLPIKKDRKKIVRNSGSVWVSSFWNLDQYIYAVSSKAGFKVEFVPDRKDIRRTWEKYEHGISR